MIYIYVCLNCFVSQARDPVITGLLDKSPNFVSILRYLSFIYCKEMINQNQSIHMQCMQIVHTCILFYIRNLEIEDKNVLGIDDVAL